VRVRLGVILTLGLVLATTACGPGGGGPQASPSAATTPKPSTTTPASPSASPSVSPSTSGTSQLTIVVDDGAGETTTWTLTCDPAGGTHPDPEEACAAVDGHRSALNPVPKGKMCAQVYGGPESATVTGTWRGEQILATLSRTDACQTARWDALVGLLPPGGR
jgi:hypothetical protein